MRRLRAVLAVGSCLIGCGGSRLPGVRPPPPIGEAARPPASDAPPRGPSRRAAIAFALGGRPFPLPVVHGSVAGEGAWMIVDTGATSHAITAWFASKHGLPLSPAAGSATDHAGRAVRMFRTEAAVVTLDGWGSLGTGPFLVYEMPEIIERLGVGMFVAPQALVEEGRAVVLDLAARELRMEPVVDALRARAGTPLPAAKACVEAGSIRGLSYVVPAKIGGHDARLLVDTGAQHTDLFESSKAGKALAASATAGDDKTWGASGRIRSRRVEGAAVALGDHAARVNVDILPGAAPAGACPRDGVLAMDALAGCVLVFAGDELATTCASSLGP